MLASIAMIAMTTNNSISVKCTPVLHLTEFCRDTPGVPTQNGNWISPEFDLAEENQDQWP